MRAAREAADEEAVTMSMAPPLVIAVTVLTSLDEAALGDVGVSGPSERPGGAPRRARAGRPGSTASSRRRRRSRSSGSTADPRFAIVTPGIRGVERCERRSAPDDERRRSPGRRRQLPRRRPADHRGARPARGGRTHRGGLPAAATVVISLTIYSRPGCHLCDEMKAVVARVARAMPLSLEEIDISTDPALEARTASRFPCCWWMEEKSRSTGWPRRSSHGS